MRSSLYIVTFVLSTLVVASFSLPHQSDETSHIPLECKFERTIYSARTYYTCSATNLIIHDESSQISEVLGKHFEGKSNSDVNALIVDRQDVKFLPTNLNEIFENLNRIEVTNSKLEKISSESFKELKLEVLKLSKNKIKKIDEKAFEDLKELEKLFLDRNEIEKLSDETFASLNFLKVLRLENNKLKTVSENLLQNLPELQQISLADNKIRKLSAETFKNCENLEEIDFSNNKLKVIDAKILENLRSLKKFHFGGNDCTKLTALDDGESQVEVDEVEAIFEEFCSNDENFDPSTSSEIYSLPPLALCDTDTTDLQLELQDLKEEKLEIEAFCESTNKKYEEENHGLKLKVQILEAKMKQFEGNDAKNVECTNEDELKELREKLQKFETQSNCKEIIENFDTERSKFLTENENLKFEVKNLENCQSELKSLEEKFEISREIFESNLSSLKHELSGCQASLRRWEKQKDESVKELQKCERDLIEAKRSPTIHQITNSPLYREQHRIISDLTYQLDECSTKLVYYQQKCQDVEVFSPNRGISVDSCYNLQSNLDRCKNSLRVFSTFPLECKFFVIDFEYTCIASKVITNHKFMQISAIHGNHQGSRSNFDVQKLKISNSIFKFFTNEIFVHFKNLQSLEIFNSKLESLSDPKIESRALKNLQIDFNDIKILRRNSFDGVRNLENLFLTANGIEKIESGTFNELSKLQKLDLKSNQISSLPTGIFDDFRELTHLSMSDNKLEVLDGDLLRNLGKLQVVKFDGNKIKVIGRDLLNYSRSLRIFNFRGTCVDVGDRENEDVYAVIRSIENKCGEY